MNQKEDNSLKIREYHIRAYSRNLRRQGRVLLVALALNFILVVLGVLDWIYGYTGVSISTYITGFLLVMLLLFSSVTFRLYYKTRSMEREIRIYSKNEIVAEWGNEKKELEAVEKLLMDIKHVDSQE